MDGLPQQTSTGSRVTKNLENIFELLLLITVAMAAEFARRNHFGYLTVQTMLPHLQTN